MPKPTPPAADLEALALTLGAYRCSARLQIALILQADPGRSAGELQEVLRLSFSAVSQHLARMRALGFVVARRDGQRVFYSLAPHPVTEVLALAEG